MCIKEYYLYYDAYIKPYMVAIMMQLVNKAILNFLYISTYLLYIFIHTFILSVFNIYVINKYIIKCIAIFIIDWMKILITITIIVIVLIVRGRP